MKKWIAIVLCALLLCGCAPTAAEETTTPPTTETQAVADDSPLSDGKTLKVLAIGNSFSNNTTEYLYNVAAAEGVTDITVGRLYISGCSLQKHASNAQTDAPAYTYYKNTTGVWDTMEGISLLYALQDEAWDIITLQQSSGLSGQADSYGSTLDTVIEYVNQNKTNPNARLVWHMTWAYQSDCTQSAFANYGNSQDMMYTSILNAVEQKIVTNDAFYTIIPTGTAVQNARTSFIGDTLTRDGYHLNELGKVLGAYSWYATFVGKPLEKISLDGIPGAVVLTDKDKAVIVESINNALATPFEVTASTHTN